MRYLSVLIVALLFFATGCISGPSDIDHHGHDIVHHHPKMRGMEYLVHHMNLQSDKLYVAVTSDTGDPNPKWEKSSLLIMSEIRIISEMTRNQTWIAEGRPSAWPQSFNQTAVQIRVTTAKEEIFKIYGSSNDTKITNLLLSLDSDLDLFTRLLWKL